MVKPKSLINCLIGIFCTVCLLLGLVPTAFSQVNTLPSETLPAGTLMPLAVVKEMADQHESYNTPQNPIRWGSVPPGTMPPVGWTSLGPELPTLSILRALIIGGNPYPISIGTDIALSGGTLNTVLSELCQRRTGQDVVLPVILVDRVITSIAPVYGFIGFHITACDPLIEKYIEGYFLDSVFIEGGIGNSTAPDYGVRSPSPIPEPDPLITLPQTGQKTCYSSDGNAIACEGTGQDGEFQAGNIWPEPRFFSNEDNTITDNLTGLTWMPNANLLGVVSWEEALNYIATINSGDGYNDWHLPNVNELESLVNLGVPDLSRWLGEQGFYGVATDSMYWTSTTDASDINRAWLVSMWSGEMGPNDKVAHFYVWPVRLSSTTPNISKTGQTISYAPGDDGHLQLGIPWPSPRFEDNGDGTIKDNFTSLIWTQDTNILKGLKTWQEALDYVAEMNAGTKLNFGYYDWRLPNRKELQSLTDFSKSSPALPSEYPFLPVSLSEEAFWSSDTYGPATTQAFRIYLSLGWMDAQPKNSYYNYVWPVRGGVFRKLGITPSSNDFGNVEMGMASAQEFTILNQGTDQIIVDQINIVENDAGQFAMSMEGTNPCPSLTPSLEPGTSCTLMITFTPISSGTKLATMQILSNAPNSPQNIALTGTGIREYTITSTAGVGGSINPTGSTTVNYGGSQTFTMAPSVGYQVADVLVDGVSVGAVSTYTFPNVTTNHTISINFSVVQLTITASSGANGTITPSGAVSVNYGTSLTFYIAPNIYYRIADVKVDGFSVGPTEQFQLNNVTANHTIEAVFALTNIAVSIPNGGESWQTGTDQTIQWNYIGNPGVKVKIELLKGGAVYKIITSGAKTGKNGKGSYIWKVPRKEVIGNDYRIKITSTTTGEYSDVSDNYFNIISR